MVKPIGVIDSGVGGLTVVKEMRKMLPNESIIYLGDDLRCPYGSRTSEEVQKFTIEMATKLAELGIKMLVIACNTATAVALELIREKFDFPVVGVIIPGSRAAVTTSKTSQIAVLGTTRTIESGAYTEEVLRQRPDAKVHALACPDFVPIVESGQYRSKEAGVIIHQTLQNLRQKDFDVAILGCTHYPLLEGHIRKSLPEHVQIISSAVETVRDVEKELNNHRLMSHQERQEEVVFYTTGSQESFNMIVKDWLGIKDPDIRTITLP